MKRKTNVASYDKVGIDGVCQKTTGIIVVLNTNAVNISYLLLDVQHNLLVFSSNFKPFLSLLYFCSRTFNYILYTLLQEQLSLKACTLLERERADSTKVYEYLTMVFLHFYYQWI